MQAHKHAEDFWCARELRSRARARARVAVLRADDAARARAKPGSTKNHNCIRTNVPNLNRYSGFHSVDGGRTCARARARAHLFPGFRAASGVFPRCGRIHAWAPRRRAAHPTLGRSATRPSLRRALRIEVVRGNHGKVGSKGGGVSSESRHGREGRSGADEKPACARRWCATRRAQYGV